VIFVVRHAHAGSRAEWEGPDSLRPLSAKGRSQAEAIGGRLAARGATAMLSSPYLRCVETMEPGAALVGALVEEDDGLREGAGADRALDLVTSAPSGTALCTHGDVLAELVGVLAARGAPLDPYLPFAKGAVLLLEREDGRIVGARYERPE